MADEPQKTERFTFAMTVELDQRMRDFSTILGITPGEMCIKALEKYMDAVENAAGDKFQKAKQALAEVRKLV